MVSKMYFVLSFFLISTNIFAQSQIFEDSRISKPLDLRDPFKAPLRALEKKAQKKTLLKDGIYTNIFNSNGLPLESLKVTGVISGEEKRAIVLSGNSEITYMLKEGSKIANGQVELKSILPNGAIFVEKITNVYGQLEYIETVVPISE